MRLVSASAPKSGRDNLSRRDPSEYLAAIDDACASFPGPGRPAGRDKAGPEPSANADAAKARTVSLRNGAAAPKAICDNVREPNGLCRWPCVCPLWSSGRRRIILSESPAQPRQGECRGHEDREGSVGDHVAINLALFRSERNASYLEAERRGGCPYSAIQRALEAAGVEFIVENGGGPGVRLKAKR